MNFNPAWLFIPFFILAVINGFSVLGEYQDCHAHGGQLVKGFSWNGYVCVGENK
jgi:hypothetical protein